MKTKSRILSTLVAACLFSWGTIFATELFPFVLPWDDASPGLTNLSSSQRKPAGNDGFVRVQDGHLFAGNERLRIFGVNMAFGANFPSHGDAEKVAARMAKFGINCVRFHHMDMQASPGGIWKKDLKTFDPEQLDRLDYFIAELKKQGIYTDLNLHVSRTYPDRPKSEKEGNPNFDAGVDNFSAPLIALQKDYARELLTHTNPYTGKNYLEEPAVALIEINNENALLWTWNNGKLDEAAAPYRAELSELWLRWLREKYGDETRLREAWKVGARPAGEELLSQDARSSAQPASSSGGWNFEQHGSAKATGLARHGRVTVQVEQPGSETWHVQFNRGGLSVDADSYVVTFRGQADPARTISIGLGQTQEPYKVLASQTISLTPESREYRVLLRPGEPEKKARLAFTGMGLATGTYAFSEISLRSAPLDGLPPAAAFTKAEYASRPEAAQRDWYAFLWQLEEKYWRGMYSFLREELKARSLIVGTQLGWSPFPIQSHMDVIDSHAYWQHPHFPNKAWDPKDWTVKNLPMAGAVDGGTLAGLALQRVAGKPYICTEYNHAAPNEFCSETFPLICAFAALQDWDGVFAFAYSHRHDDWAKGYFPSFFDIDQHPTKMATLPASIATFLRGDLSPAPGEAKALFTLSEVQELARNRGPRISAERADLERADALRVRVGVALAEKSSSLERRGESSSEARGFVWDEARKRVTIDTRKSKAVIGAMRGEAIDLDGVKITPGNDWGVIQLTVMKGDDFRTAASVLITATGRAENTDMKWQSAARDSVGRDWGKAPSLVEGISATITLPIARRLKAWALDERGQRKGEVPVQEGTLHIAPEHRTLWYEIAAQD